MKKFKDLSEQYREEGRFKPVITHNVKSTGVGPRPQVDSVKTKLKEDQLDEGRPSQRHPLEGHDYHKKSNAELVGIAKDAHEAAEAMKSHNTTAENKYRDQANDSATVRYFRQKSGMPDWYKKKYGHMKEETDTSEKSEMAQTQLHFIKYAAEEILEFIKMGGEIEEWYQNKLSKVQSEVEGLHSYVEGESRRTGMKEESELDEGMNRQARERAADTQAARERTLANNPRIAAEVERRRKAAEDKKKQPSVSEETEDLQESRRANIVREAMEAAKKKKKQQSADTFNADPTLSSEIVKS